MKVNYLLEINRLHRWEMTNPLKPAEFKLLMKLLDLANSQDFPEELRVTTSLLKGLMGCSESSLLRARAQLIESGRISCRAHQSEATIYAINYFSIANPAFCATGEWPDERPEGSSDGSPDGSCDGSSEGSLEGSPDGSCDGENRINATDLAVSSIIRKTKPNQTKPDQTDEEVYPTIEEGARAASGKENRLREMAAYIVGTHPAFAAERDAFLALIQDRRYDARAVMEALDRTEKRCERADLASPRAYFVALLADWRNRGAVQADSA